jgi:hypothetical protein
MNATTDNRSPADLEREGDEIRADLDRTLDEIQRRFNPAELMDRSMEYFRENGSELLREAGDTIRRNPVPLLLTAAGLVWLTASVAKSRSSSSYASESGSASQFAGRASRSYTGSDDYGSEYESGDGSTSDRLRGASGKPRKVSKASCRARYKTCKARRMAHDLTSRLWCRSNRSRSAPWRSRPAHCWAPPCRLPSPRIVGLDPCTIAPWLAPRKWASASTRTYARP